MLESKIVKLGVIELPAWQPGEELYMHKIRLETPVALPDEFRRWTPALERLLESSPAKCGEAFVTIDERLILPGNSHRRPGAHVDGNFLFDWRPGGGGWLVGGEGRLLTPEQHQQQYCSPTGGTLIIASHVGARGWAGTLPGEPNQGGDLSHLNLDGMESFLLEAGTAYWMNSTGAHESLRHTQPVRRSLLRVTLPHDAPALGH